MIVTEIYKGQGLGNQLWCYVTTRVIAQDKGYDFGIQSPEKFKCNDFLNLDFGRPVTGGLSPEGGPPTKLPDGITQYYNERRLLLPSNSNWDIRTIDTRLINIPDHTKIDGIMQGEEYILHHKDEIREWLKVKKDYECYDYASDDVCVLNFRGGEYTHHPDLFLTQQYWDDAMRHMKTINPNFTFVVITDDVKTARKFFPHLQVMHFNIAKDYVIVKNAHYLILSNSSFAWFPAWLSDRLKYCIAPKYWAAYNTSDGYWSCSYNLTKNWFYLDRAGQISDYATCLAELNAYIKLHSDYFKPTKIKSNWLVVSSYNNDVSWVPEYTDRYLIYDKGDTEIYPYTVDPKKVVKSPNIGYNMYDYFTFIIDHYDQLPDCTIFTKGNIFPRHVSQAYFNRIINNAYFTPIEDYRQHKENWPICFFAADGGFCEINNSWYLNINHHPTKYFHNYDDFLRFCFKEPVIPRYNRFAPGACYIVPKANILKLPKIFYENLRTFVSHGQLIGEAHIIERAFYILWTANFEISDEMLRPIDEGFVAKPKAIPALHNRIIGQLRSYVNRYF